MFEDIIKPEKEEKCILHKCEFRFEQYNCPNFEPTVIIHSAYGKLCYHFGELSEYCFLEKTDLKNYFIKPV